MNTQAPKFAHMPFLFAGITAVVFSSLAATLLHGMEWPPESFGAEDATYARSLSPAVPAPTPVAPAVAEAQVKARCDQCGVIETVRATAATADSSADTSAGYEVTVRMRDGSTRMLLAASQATWRHGERIIVIDGGNANAR